MSLLRSPRLAAALAASAIIFSGFNAAAASCALATGKPYRTADASTVFVVTDDCRKRPVFNPAVFFSHFANWTDVRFTDAGHLKAVPDHPLKFLPWGPRRTFGGGSLLKTVDDPKVYLIVGRKAFPVADEGAFAALGFSFSQVEDVTADALAKFEKQSAPVHGTEDAPDGLLFKYDGNADVYLLRRDDGKTASKSRVATMTELNTLGRGDRIAVFPVSVIIADASTPAPTPPTSSPGATAAAAKISAAPLGINLGGISDYDSSTPFIDVFSTAREFTDMSFGDASAIITARDANGWPTAITEPIQSIALTQLPYDHAGTYVLLWEGDPHGLHLGLDAKNVRCNMDGVTLDECASGRATFTLGANDSFTVILDTISETDPIRNIRVYAPGGVCGISRNKLTLDAFCKNDRGGEGSCGLGYACYDLADVGFNRFVDGDAQLATKPVFHPKYLASLKGFRTLRFMDWGATNGSPVAQWDERATPKSPTFASDRGVPVEMMVALANLVGADAWFTMPARATDAYVRSFADYVHGNLSAPLLAYVEYSNETWNGMFAQAKYVVDQGLKRHLNQTDFAAGRYYAMDRTISMGDIFKTSFGADKSRVVTTFGAWAAVSWWTGESLRYLTEDGKSAAQHGLDAVAVAPYFGGYIGSPECQKAADTMTVDDVFTEITKGGKLASCDGPAGGALAEATTWMKENADETKKYKVKLLAYEAGPHLVGSSGVENDEKITALFTAANRDPRMKGVLLDYFNRWHVSGGELLAYFSHAGGWSKWGSWGSMEHMLQSRADAPKYDALKSFNEQTLCWWEGCGR